MNILIVEDDENKRNQLISFFTTNYPDTVISTAKSFQSGLKEIVKNKHNLIILDMTMPTFDIGVSEDGGRPQAYAGREILRQMQRRDIRTPVIVVTQFDRFGEEGNLLTLEQLDEQLQSDHGRVYLGAIYYDITSGGWRDKLSKEILRIFS